MIQHIFSGLLFLCVLIALTQPSYSEVYDFTPIDSLFKLITKHNKGMGSIAIRKDGKLLYSNSMGFSSVNSSVQKKANSETGYRIGSITKMFTSVLIFQLIEQGKLTLETPLSTFYPTIKNAKSITISHLLNHRSGIHNYTDDADYQFYMQASKSKKEILEIITKKGVDFEPNEKAAYSNANYMILGFIAEDITKKSYADLIKTSICEKIDLKRTYLGKGVKESENEAQSYIFLNTEYNKTTETHPSVAYSAGSIVSTPEDVTKFIDALFHNKLLKKESLDKMVELVENYGRGIFRYPFDNSWLFGHTGGIDNFQSMVAYDTETGFSVSYIANAVAYPVNDIVIFVLSQIYKRGVVYPNFETMEVAESILKTYEGEYTSKKVPLTLKVMVKKGKLFAQATGQDEFPLDALTETKFEFLPARITLEFEPQKNEMKFEQGGLKYTFIRK
ncbi:MAG: beta-lactamase family protein [Candidatus Kapabacteria bacterium]|nr:beta-lactamase family protein [Candidatus Kapabacteria bacterium]